MIGSELSYF